MARPIPPRLRSFSRRLACPTNLSLLIPAGVHNSPEFLVVNPNGKVPAIVDDDVAMFDSNAILLYLAEKTGKFLPPPNRKAELYSWLMFVGTGIGPFCGQAVHFRHFAPEKVPYAHNRYQYEAQRHFTIVERRLAKHQYLVGETYTFVDMSLWAWTRMIPFILGDDAWSKFPNAKRYHDMIAARPATQRALALKDRFPFKADMDAEARGHMFKHIAA